MSDKPLAGLQVVVTRPRSRAGSLAAALEDAGAVAVQVPAIRIEDPADGGAALRAALDALTTGDWLVLTSPNGASRTGAALSGRPLPGRVAVIGPGTRAAAEAAGLSVDLEAGRSLAEGLLEALGDPPPGGGRVLLARAETGRDVLPVGLAARGWTVDDVAVYRTVGADISPAEAEACRAAHIVAFTSSSAVQHLADAVGLTGLPPVVAAIGPVTARTAEALGIAVDIEAEVHTLDGLLGAIIAHAQRR